jgi:hypothetical protein
MLVGLTASWAIEYLFGISSMGIFLMHILVWFLLDYSMLRLVEVRVTLKTSFEPGQAAVKETTTRQLAKNENRKNLVSTFV